MKREDGTPIPALSSVALSDLLSQPFSLNCRVEQAAYSQAMVLRVALGLSCADASLLFVVDDCFAGALALASARQLCFAGARVSVLSLQAFSPDSLCATQYTVLEPYLYESLQDVDALSERLQSYHAALMGMQRLPFDTSQADTASVERICEHCNESQLPVHTVLCPPGIDADSGEKTGSSLLCATTFTPGLPLQGLPKAQDFCGRVYCGDVGFTPETYQDAGYNGKPFFSNQPVIQVFF